MKLVRIIISDECWPPSGDMMQVAWEFKQDEFKTLTPEVYYERYIKPALIALQESI